MSAFPCLRIRESVGAGFPLAEVEEKNFGTPLRLDVQLRLTVDRGTIAGRQGESIEGDLATNHLKPPAFA